MLLRQGELNSAEALLRNIAEVLDPQFHLVRIKWAESVYYQGDLERAQTILNVLPMDSLSLNSLAVYYQLSANIALQTNEPAKLRTLLREVVALNGSDINETFEKPLFLRIQAELLSALGENEKAKQLGTLALNLAIQQKNDIAEIESLLTLADIHAAAHSSDHALFLLDEAMKVAIHRRNSTLQTEVILKRVTLLLSSEEPNAAPLLESLRYAESLANAEEQLGKALRIAYWKGRTLLKLNQLEEAQETFVALDHDAARAGFRTLAFRAVLALIDTLITASQIENALMLAESLNLDHLATGLKLVTLEKIAKVHYLSNDYQKTAFWLKRHKNLALKANANTDMLINQLNSGLVFEKQSHTNEAEQLFLTAMQQAPMGSSIRKICYQQLIRFYEEHGRNQIAERYQTKLIEENL